MNRDSEQAKELKETVRELRFKAKALSTIISAVEFSRETKEEIDAALLRLIFHTRNEHPLTFEFRGHKVEEP